MRTRSTKRRAEPLLFACLLIVGTTTFARGARDVPRGEGRAALVAALAVEKPIAASADGARVAVQSRDGDAFELALHDATTGARVALDRSDEPQLDVAVSPDGAMAAFLEWSPDRAAFVPWLLDARGRRPLDLPASDAAVAPIVFSASGDRLLYTCAERRRARLFAVDLRSGAARAVGDEAPESTPAWRGDDVVMVAVDRPDAVTIVAPDGARRACVVTEGGRVHDLAASPDGAIVLATARAARGERAELHAIDVATGRSAPCARADADLERPRWLADGRLVVHAERVSDERPLLGTCAALEPLGVEGERLRIVGGTSGASLVGVLARSDAPPRLVRVQVRSVPSPRSDPDLPRGVEPRELRVATPSGDAYVHHWRAAHGRGAVVIVHGGPHLRSSLAWEPTIAWLVDRGIDVLAVDYAGSRGYGASFERAGSDADRVAQVAAVVDYATDRLRHPRERVALLGFSYGAYLVARASAEGRVARSPIVLVSCVAGAVGPSAGDGTERVVAFHGDSDRIVPASVAHDFLLRTFGADALGAWRVFAREGHGLHRTSSWVAVAEAVRDAVIAPQDR